MNQGFHRAIVRENNDPDKLGRLRVEYPWFQGDSSEHPSEWAAVCVPYASQAAGFWFLPEVGDEVLVYLENGNLDQPVIFGSIYSAKHAPAASGRSGDFNSNNKNDLKHIGTRSGHTLCFDDSDGKRGIVLRDRENRRLEISSSEKKVTLSDDADNCITIEPGTITIRNQGGDQVVIEKNAIHVKSQNVKIEAAASLELGQGATEALVKGQTFMSLFNSHTHTSGMSGSPTSPPMVPMTPAALSTKVKTA